MVSISGSIPRGTLRSLAQSVMDSTVEVIEQTEGREGPDGYWMPGGPTVVAEAKGRWTDTSESEQIQAQRLSATVEGTLVVPLSAEIKGTHSLRIDGVAYEVAGVPPLNEGYSVERRVLVARSS